MADMKLAAVAEAFQRLRDANPTPTTELEYASPYQLLVAVVLSAQATDKGVNIATRKLFAIAPTPEAMVDLGEAGIVEHIKTIGLFRNKAKNTLALSHQLLERHGGEVPNDRDALEALPGVGRKTANVVLNIVSSANRRWRWTRTSSASRTASDWHPARMCWKWKTACCKVAPAEYLLYAHHWLILHGRYVCTARKPLLWSSASSADLCLSRDKTD
jgi:endonuclease-3